MRPFMPVRRMLVEPLENRAVLAGNVVAQMVDSTLFITGDEFDNNVVIGGVGDEVTVQGLQTTINGNAGPATFAGVARIEVVGGNGDDFVGATLDETAGALRVNTGSGSDFVDVNTWGSDVLIDTGDGADGVHVKSQSVYSDGADIQIATGDGADFVSLDLNYYLGGTVRVDTGNGNDDVHVFFPELFGGNLSILTGNGNDTVSLYTGSAISLDGDLSIDGGRGVDALYGNPNNFTGDVNILDIEN